MTTLTATPTYPIPNRPCRIVFGFTSAADANYIRAWCTGAPEGSALRDKIDKNRLARALVYEGDGGTKRPWATKFDKGGVYTFVVQEYEKGNHWGGGYEGDPRGAPTEAKVGSEATLSLYVAQRLTQELGHGPDKATLVLYAVNDTIRQTLFAVHGEASPAVILPTSDRAKVAALDADVTTAIAALVGMSPATAFGTVGSVVDDFITKFVAHAGSGVFHQNADTQTDLNDYKGSTALPGIAKGLNKVRLRLRQHMENSKENAAANPEYALPGGIDIHDHNSLFFDLKNRLLDVTANENNPATIFQAGGDFYRSYTAHRTATMHESSDGTNTLTALPQLFEVHHQFMASLAALSPAAQPGQSSAAAQLIGTAGFKES